VEDRARTTRDRLYAVAEWNGRRFIVVDTGGLEQRPGDVIEAKVQEQARSAIAEADVIVLVVDAGTGETPGDQEAAELLRRSRVPILVAVNKADSERLEAQGAEFNHLGWDELYTLSALHGRGTGDLLDALVWALPPESAAEVTRKAQEAEAAEAAEGSVARALTLLGGDALKLHQRTAALLAALPRVDPRELHALGDALPLSDRAALSAFIDSVDRWVSERLRADNANANLHRLARLAEVWEKISRAARDTAEYNLERKPLVFSVFGLLAEVVR